MSGQKCGFEELVVLVRSNSTNINKKMKKMEIQE